MLKSLFYVEYDVFHPKPSSKMSITSQPREVNLIGL